MKNPVPNGHVNNVRTVAAYENCARQYAANVSRQPSDSSAAALRRLANALPSGGRVLEIGSGPGWDADFLENLGVRVHRTDATAAFREFQAERGQQAAALDLLTDEVAGTYEGILMLCVLQHFERSDLDAVLHKLVNGLSDKGVLLLSYQVGEDEFWEHTASGNYRVVRWPNALLDARLQRSGFAIRWHACDTDDKGIWRTVLAQRML